MRLIGAHELEERLMNFLKYHKRGFTEVEYVTMQSIINGVETSPTIDAVPVVRCKDCKYSCANYSIIKKENLLFCYHDFQGSYVDDNFYCAHGKRKDETED